MADLQICGESGVAAVGGKISTVGQMIGRLISIQIMQQLLVFELD